MSYAQHLIEEEMNPQIQPKRRLEFNFARNNGANDATKKQIDYIQKLAAALLLEADVHYNAPNKHGKVCIIFLTHIEDYTMGKRQASELIDALQASRLCSDHGARMMLSNLLRAGIKAEIVKG
jgi:hypothetical protein